MINQEEYEKIKLLPGYDWNWIAREKTGKILSFTNKPIKTGEVWKDKQTRLWFNYKDSQLFQFIQWEDEEPYRISDLIKEYDKNQAYEIFNRQFESLCEIIESEEKEMKNIEWLKEKIGELPCVDTVFNSDGSSYIDSAVPVMAVYDLIDQLDEPEVTLNRAFEKVSEIYPMTKGEVCRHLERVVAHGGKVTYGEQEVLSQEWIDEHAVAVTYDGIPDETEIVYVDELENLLIPKKELPVVPKYVAEYLELAKSEVSLMRVLEIANRRNELPKWEKEYDWISANGEAFARAWLDGYTAEEEPLYTARLKAITDEYIASYLRTQSSDDENRLNLLEIGNKYIYEDYRHQSEFTEDELKVFNIWDSDQWEIEEVEE